MPAPIALKRLIVGTIDPRRVRDRPAQRRDRRRLVDGFERVDRQLVLGRREAVLLERPSPAWRSSCSASCSWSAARLAEQRPAAGELADSRDPHHVVAEAAEVVEQPLLQHRHVGPRVHRQEEEAHARRHLVLAMQRRDRVVHAERIGARERVGGERLLDVGQPGDDERAHVHVRRDPDAGGIRQRVERSTLLIVEASARRAAR